MLDTSQIRCKFALSQMCTSLFGLEMGLEPLSLARPVCPSLDLISSSAAMTNSFAYPPHHRGPIQMGNPVHRRHFRSVQSLALIRAPTKATAVVGLGRAGHRAIAIKTMAPARSGNDDGECPSRAIAHLDNQRGRWPTRTTARRSSEPATHLQWTWRALSAALRRSWPCGCC